MVPPDILHARLEARGRETVVEIKARLDRAAAIQALGDDVIRFNNDRPLEKSIEAFVALISD
jgi:ribose 1,5-bisphosphokinase PhnN